MAHFATEADYERFLASRGKNPAQGKQAQALPIPEKESKYKNKATVVDGLRFPSRREANRYAELRLLERAGKIEDLRTQVRYPLEVNGLLVSHYVADFTYLEKGKLVVEDAKGHITPVYVIKKKHMAAQYGIEIKET
jgi:hypothetical protein